MADELTVRLSFPAKPDYLLLARLALSGIARELPLDDEELADLKLAVTEACGNAVRHAYPDGDPGDVSVSYFVRDDRIVMTVEDYGAGFHSVEVPREPVTGPVDAGMGLAIMKTIVDELDVSSGADGRGTVVRMTKRLSSPVDVL
jgi:serine/threonine-protein kinase RsbW